MKEFLVIFTIIQLISALPDRCGNGVKHPYPGDHTKFIVCENDIPIAKKCPVGTTFNSNVQVCDSSSTSKYNDQSPGQNNILDNRLGSGYNKQHLVGSDTLSFVNSESQTNPSTKQIYDQTLQGNYNQLIPSYVPDQLSSGVAHSGHSTSNLPNNQYRYNDISSSGQGLGSTFNQNPQYADKSKVGYQGVPGSYPGAVPGQYYGNQGQETGYNYQHNTGIKKNNQHTDSGNGGSYYDHKNVNTDNGLWLQNQNHGLNQDHINLNEIRSSTGHSANSCNRSTPGQHIAYPGDCTKFIVCVQNGNNVVKNCPPSTHFNPVFQICDWPEAAGCAY